MRAWNVSRFRRSFEIDAKALNMYCYPQDRSLCSIDERRWAVGANRQHGACTRSITRKLCRPTRCHDLELVMTRVSTLSVVRSLGKLQMRHSVQFESRRCSVHHRSGDLRFGCCYSCSAPMIFKLFRTPARDDWPEVVLIYELIEIFISGYMIFFRRKI